MAFADIYRRQVALLTRLLPLAEEKCFALRGGTAINLFIRDMPRLSVDIDLTYVAVEPRPQSLSAIDAAFGRIIERIKKSIRGAQITEARTENARTRLLVRAEGVQIKIEVTPVLRGCVYPAGVAQRCQSRGKCLRLCRNAGRVLRRSLCGKAGCGA